MRISKKLEGILKREPTFRKLLDVSRKGEVIWVMPKMLMEVNYCSWTKDALLRHTSFKGLREDKTAREVTVNPF